MTEFNEHRAIRKWMDRTGLSADQKPAYQRMANVVLDAMKAAEGEKPDIAIRLTVLLKAQAALLSTLLTDQLMDVVDDYCITYADTLSAEVFILREAAARDLARRRRGG